MNTQRKPVPDTSLKVATLSLDVRALNLSLDGKNILHEMFFTLQETGITTLIGPSGAGKSSILRCMTRMYSGWTGCIHIQGRDVCQWPGGGDALRKSIGLIAQKPAVFPASIHDNVMFGLRGKQRKQCPEGWVEKVLRQAALWDEVHDRLHEPAHTLSLGQQQRLCIARALALSPTMLLLDEPTSSLDPRSKQMIEHSLCSLAEGMPVLCVTHDMEQARRLGGQVIFICDGHVIESSEAAAFFSHPKRIESREFLRWSVCDCDA